MTSLRTGIAHVQTTIRPEVSEHAHEMGLSIGFATQWRINDRMNRWSQ